MTLTVRDLHVAYGKTVIVGGVSLTFERGEIAALIGPNGAGKSTLLKGIAGLTAMSGKVGLNGDDLALPARRQAIAYMPQDIGPISSLSLLEVVLMGRLQTLGLAIPGMMIEAAMAALDRFGLKDLHGRSLDQVSGGQRQLAYLAQALFREPTVLLLDEPTAALDLRHQLVVLDAVRAHGRSHGTIAIIAMHDLMLAASFFERMICLHQGRIDADAAPKAVLTPDLLRRVYKVDADVDRTSSGHLHISPRQARMRDR